MSSDIAKNDLPEKKINLGDNLRKLFFGQLNSVLEQYKKARI